MLACLFDPPATATTHSKTPEVGIVKVCNASRHISIYTDHFPSLSIRSVGSNKVRIFQALTLYNNLSDHP